LRSTVDFRSVDVSVGVVNSLNLTLRIKKPLMVSAVLISFTFGAFAMSLAYESASNGPSYAASPYHVSGDGLLRSDTFAQRLAVICLSGDVPRSAQPNFQAYRIHYVRVVDPVTLAFLLENHVPKRSLQILQSVLLI
jgi:multisubunit Na+/H+ antiporter MnhC subunit